MEEPTPKLTVTDKIKQLGFRDIIRKLKIGPLFVLPLGLYACYKSLKVVHPGHVGYQNLFGKVSEKEYKSGIHLINPFASMINMSLKTKALNSEVSVASKEGLNIDIKIDTIYRLKKEESRNIFINIGQNYEAVLLEPQLNSMLRDIISGYDAKALYTDSTREEIKKKLITDIKKKAEFNGIIVEDVLVNRIRLPFNLQNSIEEKLKSEQEMEKMNFVIEKERKEADRKKIEAEGIKSFQSIVSEGISEQLLRWKGIEATKSLQNSPNSKIIIIGGKDGLPIIFNSESK